MVKHKAPARKILSCQRNAQAFLFLYGNLYIHAKRGYTYDRTNLAHRRCAIFWQELPKSGLRYFWPAKSNKRPWNARQCIYKNVKLWFTL